MVNKQVYQVIDFARRLPHFLKLSQNDQRYLMKHSWNEVLILSVAYLSTSVSRALKFLAQYSNFNLIPFISTSKTTDEWLTVPTSDVHSSWNKCASVQTTLSVAIWPCKLESCKYLIASCPSWVWKSNDSTSIKPSWRVSRRLSSSTQVCLHSPSSHSTAHPARDYNF